MKRLTVSRAVSIGVGFAVLVAMLHTFDIKEKEIFKSLNGSYPMNSPHIQSFLGQGWSDETLIVRGIALKSLMAPAALLRMYIHRKCPHLLRFACRLAEGKGASNAVLRLHCNGRIVYQWSVDIRLRGYQCSLSEDVLREGFNVLSFNCHHVRFAKSAIHGRDAVMDKGGLIQIGKIRLLPMVER